MHSFCFLALTCFGFGRLSCCCIELLGVLQCIPRVIVSLPAEFVSGKMICFAVGDCCGSVGVGCQIVKFCGLIVRTLGHGVPLPCWMQTIGTELGKNGRCLLATPQYPDFRTRESARSGRSRLPVSCLLAAAHACFGRREESPCGVENFLRIGVAGWFCHDRG